MDASTYLRALGSGVISPLFGAEFGARGDRLGVRVEAGVNSEAISLPTAVPHVSYY